MATFFVPPISANCFIRSCSRGSAIPDVHRVRTLLARTTDNERLFRLFIEGVVFAGGGVFRNFSPPQRKWLLWFRPCFSFSVDGLVTLIQLISANGNTNGLLLMELLC